MKRNTEISWCLKILMIWNVCFYLGSGSLRSTTSVWSARGSIEPSRHRTNDCFVVRSSFWSRVSSEKTKIKVVSFFRQMTTLKFFPSNESTYLSRSPLETDRWSVPESPPSDNEPSSRGSTDPALGLLRDLRDPPLSIWDAKDGTLFRRWRLPIELCSDTARFA